MAWPRLNAVPNNNILDRSPFQMKRAEERRNMLEAALKYAKDGYAVLPLKGKLPLTKHGYKDASRDVAQIAKWWGKHPDANIGIATGDRSGLVVLDIDIKKGKRGDESLKELEKEY